MSRKLTDQEAPRGLEETLVLRALREQARGPRFHAMIAELRAAEEALYEEANRLYAVPDSHYPAPSVRISELRLEADAIGQIDNRMHCWTVEQIRGFEAGAPFEWVESFSQD